MTEEKQKTIATQKTIFGMPIYKYIGEEMGKDCVIIFNDFSEFIKVVNIGPPEDKQDRQVNNEHIR